MSCRRPECCGLCAAIWWAVACCCDCDCSCAICLSVHTSVKEHSTALFVVPSPTTFSLFILAYMCCLSYEGSLHPSLLARPLILSVPSLPPPPPHLSLSFLPIFPLPPFPFKFASGELAKCRSLQEMWVLNNVWDGQWHRE